MQISNKVTVETTVHAPIEKVWTYWTEPDHIKNWNSASEDWHTPFAENDLRAGGSFVSRMEAKDGSAGFDMGGVYDEVVLHERISYTMADGRTVQIQFKENGNETEIVETFDAESTHPVEFQQQGWQAILDNFKNYAEGSN
ncbi:SRPBCC family protein [Cytobacillus gottheilii]|uniref:SRPBCC family protein n=1 Tax=Cytobacillus gottheilii TaxID=859144 RepID=UPI0009BA021F|nr:SRPBCC family protein [Cytobacillus gottheilii]